MNRITTGDAKPCKIRKILQGEFVFRVYFSVNRRSQVSCIKKTGRGEAMRSGTEGRSSGLISKRGGTFSRDFKFLKNSVNLLLRQKSMLVVSVLVKALISFACLIIFLWERASNSREQHIFTNVNKQRNGLLSLFRYTFPAMFKFC